MAQALIADKHALFEIGVEAANAFLDLNGIARPKYVTYEEAQALLSAGRVKTYFQRATTGGRLVGTGTGLYYDAYVFVNVPATALPAQQPYMRNWSWPGYKVDRTAVGVVAHEVGHHVEACYVAKRPAADRAALAMAWREGLRRNKRERVSGYEPVPSEAWAESMRVFILNPDLLGKACPWRYAFIVGLGLRPLPALLRKGWRAVLANKAYHRSAERWIGRAA